MKVKGRVEAVSIRNNGVKLNGKWYSVVPNVMKFIKKGESVEAELENGKVKFVKKAKEQIQASDPLLEEININLIQIANSLKTLVELKAKELEAKGVLTPKFEEPKEEGINDEEENEENK